MTKQELIADIKTRTDFCIGDANTYLWAKCQPGFGEAPNVGGGNFVVLLASFSLVDLLSYVNGLLSREDVYTQKEVNSLKGKVNYKIPKVGNIKISSTDLVKKLIIETTSLTGISLGKIDLMWNIRHKLTHEFNPKFLPAASYPPMPRQDYHELVERVKDRKVFTKDTSNQDCIDVHAFNHKLQRIAYHVISKIEKADDITVGKISNWLTVS